MRTCLVRGLVLGLIGPILAVYGKQVELNKAEITKQVHGMFRHAYDSYMQYAYPADELMPLSCEGRTRGVTKSRGEVDDALGNFQLTLIDSLDTLALLGYVDDFKEAIVKLNKTLNLDGDFVISTFETNIRVLGGLLGGHAMALELAEMGKMDYDNCILRFAKIMGDKLLPAFNTTTGIPMSRINLKTGTVKKTQPETCTACAGTLILEFAALSRFTGDGTYEEKARIALDSIWKKRHHGSGLVGTVINVNNGDWVRRESGIGAGIDSYYEYLLKAYILLGDEAYLERFNIHYDAIKRFIQQGPMMIDVHMHRPTEQSRSFIDSLSAFWPGVQVLKGDIQSAVEIHELLYQVFKKYGFIPEAFTHKFDVHWGQNPLRPEFAESTYILYKATHDPYYLQVGLEIINTLETYARKRCGYAGIKDVRKKNHEDRMDSFFLAEMFKYLYLLFAEDSELLIDPNKFVFTTEAHLLPLWLSSFKNHTKNVEPTFSKSNPDGSPEKSCPNPRADNKSGTLFDMATLEMWRASSRTWIQEKAKKPQKMKSQGKADIKMATHLRIRAKDYVPGNEEHEKLLNRMGIHVEITHTGQTQLIHKAELAVSTAAANEGLVFMTEMIELNKEAEKNSSLDTMRFFAVLIDGEEGFDALAGPAQFGDDFYESPLIGEVEYAYPSHGCSQITNPKDIQGKIALVYRGECMFAKKVLNAEIAGAIGAIVIDNKKDTSSETNSLFSMAPDGESTVKIGSIFLGSREGYKLERLYEKYGSISVLLSHTEVDVKNFYSLAKNPKQTHTNTSHDPDEL